MRLPSFSLFSALLKPLPHGIEFLLLVFIQLPSNLNHDLNPAFEEIFMSFFLHLLDNCSDFSLLVLRQVQLPGKFFQDIRLSSLGVRYSRGIPVLKIIPGTDRTGQRAKDEYERNAYNQFPSGHSSP